MIQVHVLARSAYSGKHFVSLPFQGQNIEMIIDCLNIDRTDIGLILDNGKPVRLSDRVEDASEIYILPAIEGG